MLFFLLACGDNAKDTGVSEEDAALWEEISDYSDWQQLENLTGVNASDSVHGVAMQTWYNDTAYDGLMQGEEAMPNGSIIVKEGYADAEGSDVKEIKVMKKIDGFLYASWNRFFLIRYAFRHLLEQEKLAKTIGGV